MATSTAPTSGRCSLVSTSFGPTTFVAKSALDFDDSVPPPPPPSVTVTPHTDLVQGQSVTVTGANFAPSSFVGLSECLTDTEYQPFCSPGGSSGVQTDATGAFTQQFSVRRGVLDFGSSYPPEVEDCAESPGYCSIIVFSFDGQDRRAQAIDFDPSVPIPVPDTSVSPQFDIPDRGVVHVHSSGFAPGERVLVSQCVAGAPTYGYACARPSVRSTCSRPTATASSTRRSACSASSRRPTAGSSSSPPPRRTAPTRWGRASCGCSRSTTRSRSPTSRSASIPPRWLRHRPSPSLRSAPSTTGSRSRSTAPGSPRTQCSGSRSAAALAANPSGDSCDSGDNGLYTQFSADSDGTFTRTVTLHTTVETTQDTLDCSAAGVCMLFAANRADYAVERTSTPIEFAGVAGTEVRVEGISQTRALAFTGAGGGTAPTALAGFVLLLVGGVLVLLTRRGRRPSSTA